MKIIRKLALATCIAIVVSLPIPLWKATQNALAAAGQHPLVQWAAIVLAWLFAAILPLFYLALWRSKEDPRITRPTRWMSLAGAAAGCIVAGTSFPVTTLRTTFSDLATVSCVVLLIGIFRHAGETKGRPSHFLRVMTLVAVIGGGIWLAFNLLAMVMRPSEGTIKTVLEQACLFTAPFVIFMGARRD